jgi:hypothetical protein
MEAKAYKYIIRCPKCDKPMTIVDVYFTKGTVIAFEVLCVKDNIYEERQADYFQIQLDILRKLGTTVCEGTETVQ